MILYTHGIGYLERAGELRVQFSDAGRYVGNVCEAKLLRYPAWRALGLPE